MPRIVKFYEVGSNVQSYQYSAEFPDIKIPVSQEEENGPFALPDFTNDTLESVRQNKKESAKVEDFQETTSKPDPEELLAQARQQAEELLAQARQEAEQMKQSAYDAGYEKGTQEGTSQAYAEYQAKLDRECSQFLEDFQSVIAETTHIKEELFQKYKRDLKNLAIAVGEKVIHISLQSCGDVIEKMIVSATEKLKQKEWAKVYISKCDAERMVEGDAELLNHISHLSKHIKIIVMEQEASGTCIIELPDEIIDASASTQVENIKEILNHASV